MNAARRAARAGRNLLIALLLGAVIIIAIVIAYVAGRGSSSPSAQTSPSAQSQPATAESSASANADAAPTGCLGGQARDGSMLLATQKQASSSTFGAVETAASFFRWSYRTPTPTAAEVRSAGAIFVPKAALTSENSMIADYARNAGGSAFYITTVGGSWLVEPGAISGDERVSVVAPLVIDGGVSATKTASEAFDMRWVSGAWRVVSLAKVDPARVVAGGTSFTAGC